MGTNLYYGDILIHNVETRRWDEEVVYDPTGVDVLAHRFNITVEGMVANHGDDGVAQSQLQTTNVHEVPYPETGITVRGGDAHERYADLRQRLMTPRQELRIAIGNPLSPTEEKTLLHVIPSDNNASAPSVVRYGDAAAKANASADVDNGPKPRGANITKIVGQNIYKVVFTIEATKIDTLGGEGRDVPTLDPTTGIVVSNRWKSRETFDENFYCTRVISGRLRVSSKSVSPHMYRSFCVPELEMGFRRKGFEFAESDDGLELEYSIQDRQVKTAAPWPATSISGTHSIGIRDQFFCVASVNLHLEGPPQVAKDLLIARAVQCAEAKLKISEMTKDQFVFETGAIVDQFGENNGVDVSMQIRYFPGDDLYASMFRIHSEFGLPLELPDLTDEDGNTITYSNVVSPTPPPYGYTVSAYNEVDPITESSSSSGSATADPNPSMTYGVRNGGFLAFMRCWYQSPSGAQTSHAMPIVGSVPAGADTEAYDNWDPSTSPYSDYSYDVPAATQYPPGSVPGTIDAEDDYIDSDAKTDIFTCYRASTKLIENHMRLQFPLADAAASGSGSVFTQLAPTQCRRRVHIEAERVGRYPNMPDPDEVVTLGGIDHYPVGKHEIDFQDPKLTADGETFVYMVVADYEYGLERQPQGTDEINVGVPLYSNLVRDDESLVRNEYYKLDGVLYS